MLVETASEEVIMEGNKHHFRWTCTSQLYVRGFAVLECSRLVCWNGLISWCVCEISPAGVERDQDQPLIL